MPIANWGVRTRNKGETKPIPKPAVTDSCSDDMSGKTRISPFVALKGRLNGSRASRERRRNCRPDCSEVSVRSASCETDFLAPHSHLNVRAKLWWYSILGIPLHHTEGLDNAHSATVLPALVLNNETVRHSKTTAEQLHLDLRVFITFFPITRKCGASWIGNLPDVTTNAKYLDFLDVFPYDKPLEIRVRHLLRLGGINASWLRLDVLLSGSIQTMIRRTPRPISQPPSMRRTFCVRGPEIWYLDSRHLASYLPFGARLLCGDDCQQQQRKLNAEDLLYVRIIRNSRILCGMSSKSDTCDMTQCFSETF
ncbi:hypothetical protein CEXT_34271 [Caerostris extrusa]|uniref:Uncharacterized protein n=1 Tax=Caerostris extrusa TaxID=172846 RepID=A0AAV4PKR4_CAEEX|nr:hypothetical protein CEXT_34271 [Caerostris extrusa]